jgi:K+-sensing histidine kinase KdpD
MAAYKISELNSNNSGYQPALEKITTIEKRKTTQYIGEGAVFFLLIITGAVYIYRVVKGQFKISRQQQNFMMAITHELKTPIAVTKLNLETLQKRKLEENQQQRLIQNTIQETNRLNALCNNMLLYSQIEEGGYKIIKEQVNLSVLVSECINEFQTRFPQRQYIAAVKPGLDIQGDLLLIQMAINNLIDNATKYTAKHLPVSILLFGDNAGITFQIKDEGKGIAHEDKKKVFDKFYRVGNTATKEAKGTGLGLYLTKKIVHQHKANIFVTDNTPVGSIFTINFKE